MSFPYQLVDRLVTVDPGVRATATKHVSANEPYFVGHFPGIPVLPGVVLCEALVQLGGHVAAAEGRLRLSTIERARFRRPVVPGDCLHVRVTKQRHRRNVWRFEGRAEVRGQLMAEAVFAAMIMDD